MSFIKSFITGDWDDWYEEEVKKINCKYEKEIRKNQEAYEKSMAELDTVLGKLN